MGKRRYRIRTKLAIALFLIVGRKRKFTLIWWGQLLKDYPDSKKIEIPKEDLPTHQRYRPICKSMTDVIKPE